MKSDSESKESLMSKLKVDLHPIIRNFPPCVSHFAVLRALFVQDRIRVVDVNKDPPATACTVEFLKQTASSRQRDMANFPRRFRPNAGRSQFVLRPECAVDQT